MHTSKPNSQFEPEDPPNPPQDETPEADAIDDEHESPVTGTGRFDRRPAENALKKKRPTDLDLDTTCIGTAMITGAPDGERVVGEQHARIYADRSAGLESELRGHQLDAQRYIERSEAHMQALERKAAKLFSHKTVTDGTGSPWNSWSLASAILFGLAAFALIGIGWNSLAIILLESGVESFEGWMAYVYSAVPFGLPFALKAIATPLEQGTIRRRFTIFTAVTGIILGLLWAALLVQTFPSLGETGDLLELDVKDTGVGPGSLMLFLGLAADVFLAATCWFALEDIIARHQGEREVRNPHHARLMKETKSSALARDQAHKLKIKVDGRLEAVTGQREAFVRQAQNEFLRLREGEYYRGLIERDLPPFSGRFHRNQGPAKGTQDSTNQNQNGDNRCENN